MNQVTCGGSTIHIVLHETKDTVGTAVVEGIKTGSQLNAWFVAQVDLKSAALSP